MQDNTSTKKNQQSITKILTAHVSADLYVDVVAFQTYENIKTMPEAINVLLRLGIIKHKEQKQNN